jgi:predicted DNA-binding antitoxin AbrB/MazE fold protein/4-amino-4-deoxy-L-arabinose transferase-like glycosyltransferase
MSDAPTTPPDNTSAPDPASNGVPVVRIVVEAVYEDGVIKPRVPLDLPPGTPITLQIATRVTAVVVTDDLEQRTKNKEQIQAAENREPRTDGSRTANDDLVMAASTMDHRPRTMGHGPPALYGGPSVAASAVEWLQIPLRSSGLLASLTRADLLLLGFGLLIYALTRFIGLNRFPIYFFSDEAIQANLAADLWQQGLRDHTGTFLPPFFLNDRNWNLGFSIYLHALTVSIFGKSVFITRATSVLVTMLGAAAIGLTLKLVFNSRLWWAGVLVLGGIPGWFLHSRTAFETAMMVGFYACFLCCYLLYRYHDPRYLYPALLFGGATFYSYTNGQGVMLVSGVLLLLSDLRYHLRQPPRRIIIAILIVALLAAQLLRFRWLHPEAVSNQLRSLSSYWIQPISLGEKLAIFGQNYLQGLSPGYWFLPNLIEIDRHRWKDMGNLPLFFLPFVLVGLWVCLRQWRSSAHRAMLIAILAAPFSAALVAIGITRMLSMVVPATILTCLGLEQARIWLARRVAYAPLAIGVGVLLVAFNFSLLRTALVDAPTWFSDYGLSGMQYGAEQLFGEALPQELARSPNTRLLVSPVWANNPDAFLLFFLDEQQRSRVQFLNVDAFLLYKGDLGADQLFVMTADEYQRAHDSQKFIIDQPERILSYPNGQPGFYFVRIHYVDNVDELFAAERLARQQLVEAVVSLDGQDTLVRYSQLDIGEIRNVFDGDTQTLMRGLEANPFVIELEFSQPRPVTALGLDTASMEFTLKVLATPAGGDAPTSTQQTYRGLPDDPHVDLALAGGLQQISKLRIEITNLHEGEVGHIHVREVKLR